MNGVDWIRLYTDFFDNPKIRHIRNRKDGDTIICVWINLLCLAGKQNKCGVFMLTETIPYTDEELANEIGRPPKQFKSAMEVLRKYQMITDVDGVPAIKNWGVYQQQLDTLDRQREQTRIRVQKYRERQKQIRKGNAMFSEDVTLPNVTCNARYNQSCNANVTPTEYSRVDKSIVDNISKQASNLKEKEEINSVCVHENKFHKEDFNDLLDSFGVFGEYRNALFRFIGHLKVNFNLVMLNDRLENLIVKLDMKFEEDAEKVKALDDAIIKGYKRLECEE